MSAASEARMRSSASTPSLRSGTPVDSRRIRDPVSTTPKMGKDENNGGNVRVVVRVRAFLPRETDKASQCLIEMNPNTQATILHAPTANDPAVRRKVDKKQFTFDNSFWSVNRSDKHYADQEHIYNALGEEMMDHNFEGYHTCIFAYGQTGSGKSYTMMGSKENPGLIPRTCEDLFQRIEADASPNVSHSVRVSYFEVYNEHVRDLLGPRRDPPYYLKIRESPTEGPYIKDLTEVPVKSYDEIRRYMTQGDASRTVASTKMNDVSSRSHAVFTIHLKMITHNLDTDETTDKVARIRLVDLAGSERAKSTEATGQRLREGSNINKSLTTLGRVIATLADQGSGHSSKRNKDVVPYRDSVLTWLLKDSLGGNSKTAMIACIAPSDYDETLSTLRYADQAKHIRTRAVINEDHLTSAARDAQIAEMQETIRELQFKATQASDSKKQSDNQNAQLEEYQKQVDRLSRAMEEKEQISECKIKSLQTENEALKRHLKLALDSLKNPIPHIPAPSAEEYKENMIYDEEEEEEEDEDYGEEEDDEMAAHLEELMRDLNMYKRKVGDDRSRFVGEVGHLQELSMNLQL